MAMISQVPFQLTGRYAEHSKWEVLNGPRDSRPTGRNVVEDEGLVGAMSDKVILITGVSAGMGPETVRILALTGATIFATARNLDKAREVLGASLLETGRVHLLFMDQTDLASVRKCAAEFRQRSGGKLNILINNAGVMKTPECRTKDGFELQFGTNHLSHFLLFYLLKDILLASSTSEFHSRVVNVSSVGHRFGPVRFDNLNFEGEYEGWAAYGQSKTANIYMATQIERLYGAQGLHGYSLNPGSFDNPNLQKFSQEEMKAAKNDDRMVKYFVSLEQVCATSVYAAISKELEGKGGLYLEGASVAGPRRRIAIRLSTGTASGRLIVRKKRSCGRLVRGWLAWSDGYMVLHNCIFVNT
ncbi:Short-chain dehydrogenase TIC 32, chloroplastic [Daldinia childiae]|uniref:Short-chain dehydrogenase TIC 32, chloroplastic n=1 Tax=Daldinia childiae TaxID=326645 RepID=UPI001446E8B4|nr:Short-chain dehydrogenase TIC 32, chloroplastic [Daldinia childiae]KAF3058450.1 Short-chain dehydrogenase TIC 32, chloroplastic [Daldinia childiae]